MSKFCEYFGNKTTQNIDLCLTDIAHVMTMMFYQWLQTLKSCIDCRGRLHYRSSI